MEGNHHQVVFILRCGNTSHGPDLRVADPALPERLADLRQIFHCMRHANLLTCRTHADPVLPVQPVRAGTQPRLSPALALVVFADQFEQAVSGSIDMGSQFGDLVFQVFNLFLTPIGLFEVACFPGGWGWLVHH